MTPDGQHSTGLPTYDLEQRRIEEAAGYEVAKGSPGWRTYISPKEPIPRAVALLTSLLGVVTVIGVWSALSYGHIVQPFFLPSPSEVTRRLYSLFAHEGFLTDVWASTYRILVGFIAAALIAIPLGIAMGSFRLVQAFFEPVVGAVRYMPVTAFIPLCIIWLGIGNNEKFSIIWLGVFFPLTLIIADVSANVSKELLNIAYTLGASRWQVFLRVLLPASWPGVLDNIRISIGWAWTYLIVAELVAAQSGIGFRIIQAGRYLQTDTIIAGIVTIGILGVLTDFLLRWLYRRLFPYAESVVTR